MSEWFDRARAIARRIPVSIYPTTLILLLLQTVFVVVFHRHHIEKVEFNLHGLLVLLVSYLPSIALVQLVHLLLHRRRILLTVVNCLVILAYGSLCFVHLESKSLLNYGLVRDNFREIFYQESIKLLFAGHYGKYGMAGIALFLVLMLVLEVRWRLFSRWGRPARYRLHLLTSVMVLALLTASPVYLYDEVVCFTQSIFRYYFPRHRIIDARYLASQGIDPRAPFPFLRRVPPRLTTAASADAPHLFILALESFNANYALARTPEGKEYTPNFNRLTRQGLHIARFYGNSIQTAKGHAAMLCSILPSMRRKIFSDFDTLRLHCLPKILKEQGYETLYFDGYAPEEFDNTDVSMARLGFMHVKTMNGDFVKDVPRKYYWGWGFQDDVHYRKLFHYLDGLRATRSRRYFAFIASISNHNPYNEIPADERYLYPRPTTYEQNFANSIYLADRYMAEFFRLLKQRRYLDNSVVVVTGDHSFPIGEHGNYYNKVAAYEENFRTPMLILWSGRLQPAVVTRRIHSQIDLPPTVLELLGINQTNHFLGRSMLHPDHNGQPPIYLLQPYDGQYYAVVDRPLKYVFHFRTESEFVYDLQRDPREAHNLVQSLPDGRLARFRKQLSVMFLNQDLLEQNRIWPGAAPATW